MTIVVYICSESKRLTFRHETCGSVKLDSITAHESNKANNHVKHNVKGICICYASTCSISKI